MKDILEMERNPKYIYWITLHQSDGSRSHTICVLNNWIIDSNFQKCISLNRENLNICCSKSSYVGIPFGYEFFTNN